MPGILQWPARLGKHRVTDVPCVTSDIYPTLLDLVGVTMPGQPPLDGISLVPLLEGRMTQRPKPIGFWDHPTRGRGTPSAKLMAELLAAQKTGTEIDPHTFGPDAHKVRKQYPLDTYPGHAAWLDWPWKLHRIQKKAKSDVRFELYDLADDPDEKNNLAAEHSDRANVMRAELERWQASVVRSLNGRDYR